MSKENKFNPFEGYRYYPQANQPRLVSGCDGFSNHTIPGQLGFIGPDGTIVQMTWEKAASYGFRVLIDIPTVPIEEYARGLDGTT